MPEEIRTGKKGNDSEAPLLQGLASTLLSVDKDKGEEDFTPFRLDSLDSLQGGPPCGNYVINNNNRIASRKVSFDSASRAVLFSFLPDGENLKKIIWLLAGGFHPDCKRDRICSQGHAANGRRGQSGFGQLFADKFPTLFADKASTPGVEAGDPAIDIEIAFFSRGEGELACADRFIEEKLLKLCVSVFGHRIRVLVESRKNRMRREGITSLGNETEAPSFSSGHHGAIYCRYNPCFSRKRIVWERETILMKR